MHGVQSQHHQEAWAEETRPNPQCLACVLANAEVLSRPRGGIEVAVRPSWERVDPIVVVVVAIRILVFASVDVVPVPESGGMCYISPLS